MTINILDTQHAFSYFFNLPTEIRDTIFHHLSEESMTYVALTCHQLSLQCFGQPLQSFWQSRLYPSTGKTENSHTMVLQQCKRYISAACLLDNDIRKIVREKAKSCSVAFALRDLVDSYFQQLPRKRKKSIVHSALEDIYLSHHHHVLDRFLSLNVYPSKRTMELLQKLTQPAHLIANVMRLHGDRFSALKKQFRFDRKIVLAAVESDGSILQHTSEKLRNDDEIARIAVKTHRTALQFVSERLKNNRDIVFSAVQGNADAIEHASNHLRSDKQLVLLAVGQDGMTLQYASKKLKNDRDIVLTAVTNDGDALQYASDEFKNDRDIVLAAVQEYGLALQYANPLFGNDPEIVRLAVNNSGLALEFASETLRDQKDIVEIALRENFLSFIFVSERLQEQYRLWT